LRQLLSRLFGAGHKPHVRSERSRAPQSRKQSSQEHRKGRGAKHVFRPTWTLEQKVGFYLRASLPTAFTTLRGHPSAAQTAAGTQPDVQVLLVPLCQPDLEAELRAAGALERVAAGQLLHDGGLYVGVLRGLVPQDHRVQPAKFACFRNAVCALHLRLGLGPPIRPATQRQQNSERLETDIEA
jgi:hypothetical protein